MRSQPVLQVIEHFGLRATVDHGQANMRCPFHEEDTPSLDIRLDNGLWNCLGCGAHGGLVDFVARLDGGDHLRATMLLSALRRKPAPDLDDLAGDDMVRHRQTAVDYDLVAQWGKFQRVNWRTVSMNDPLAAYMLGERKFERGTLEAFDVRRSARPHYPVVIPWRCKLELIGYVYRLIKPVTDPETGRALKKYKFNTGFSAETAMAYYRSEGGPLLICEGIMDMMKAAEYGYPHAACIPSWRFNEAHAMFLQSQGVRSVICGLDNTPTGDAGYRLMRQYVPYVRRFDFPGKYRKDIGELSVNEFWRGVS